jgi:hypothetical protein
MKPWINIFVSPGSYRKIAVHQAFAGILIRTSTSRAVKLLGIPDPKLRGFSEQQPRENTHF